MTYYHKDYNLYVAHLLMKEVVKDPNEKVLNERYYISIEMFKFENPEVAYTEIMTMIKSGVYTYADREGENIIEIKCIRLDELDLIQYTMDGIKSQLSEKDSNGFTISSISLAGHDNIDLNTEKRKEDLKLFDQYYNYKG